MGAQAVQSQRLQQSPIALSCAVDVRHLDMREVRNAMDELEGPDHFPTHPDWSPTKQSKYAFGDKLGRNHANYGEVSEHPGREKYQMHKDWTAVRPSKNPFGDKVGRTERPTDQCLAGYSPERRGEDLGPTTYSRHKAWKKEKQNRHAFGDKQGRQERPAA